MRFQVPQFIETETKIVGPFTLKQFLWIAAGMALIFFFFMVLPTIAFVVISIPIGAVFCALAFVKIDNVPLFNYFTYGIGYTLSPRRYFFKKSRGSTEMDNIVEPAKKPSRPQSVSQFREDATDLSAITAKPHKKEDAQNTVPKDQLEDVKPEVPPDPASDKGFIEREYIIR